MTGWEAGGNNFHAWGRWAGLGRPDLVIHFMGQNDLLKADGPEMRRRFRATLDLLKENVSPSVYLATITPSAKKSSEQHAARRSHNDWLRTLPGEAQDVFDFSAAVGNATDDALLPAFDSGDQLHLSTQGSAALAEATLLPVT